MVRVETAAEGHRIVGLHIPNPAVPAVVSGQNYVDGLDFPIFGVKKWGLRLSG